MNDPSSNPPGPMRAGTVALVGRTNVGKSTLLNAALDHPLAIVSRRPQTTRQRLLGVVRHGGAEIGLLDTPGLHHPETGLGKAMNLAARQALREADLYAFVTALPRRPADTLSPHRADLELLAAVPDDRPTVLVLNKVDLIQDKRLLLPLIQAFAEQRNFAAIVPVSALHRDGIERVLDELARLLPEGPARHDEETLTDRPLRFFAAEYVREPILEATREEVPYSVAVTVDRFAESPGGGPTHVAATIVAEREGQKRILVGKGGEMLRRIGTHARHRIEELTGGPVVLKLWVRVIPNWRDRPQQLEELGYGGDGGDGTAPPIPELSAPPPTRRRKGVARRRKSTSAAPSPGRARRHEAARRRGRKS